MSILHRDASHGRAAVAEAGVLRVAARGWPSRRAVVDYRKAPAYGQRPGGAYGGRCLSQDRGLLALYGKSDPCLQTFSSVDETLVFHCPASLGRWCWRPAFRFSQLSLRLGGSTLGTTTAPLVRPCWLAGSGLRRRIKRGTGGTEPSCVRSSGATARPGISQRVADREVRSTPPRLVPDSRAAFWHSPRFRHEPPLGRTIADRGSHP